MTQNQWDFDNLNGTLVAADEAISQPDVTNAQITRALEESSTPPEPPEAHDRYPVLPGGLYWDGELLTHAEVREMTGADEEALAGVHGSIARWVSVLLERCVENIGGQPVTPAMVRRLLIGDRDALVLAVRTATFGTDLTVQNVQCPHCEAYFDATVDLTTLATIRIGNPQPRHEYTVALRRGRTAVVRLPDGAAQEETFASDDTSLPARNTLLLARCVVAVLGDDALADLHGQELARSLGLADRQTILEFIADTQPGPQLDAITFQHQDCQKEVSLPITFGELFRGV